MNAIQDTISFLEQNGVKIDKFDADVSMCFLGGTDFEFYHKINKLIHSGDIIQNEADPEEDYEEYVYENTTFRYFEEGHYICLKK